MSSISHTYENCRDIASEGAVLKFIKSISTFFRRKSISRAARIYHGDYSYHSTHDTAFCNFMHMQRITFVETGDCYVYIFDKPNYQGSYIIAGPKEVVPVCKCGSMIISRKKLPVSIIQNNGKPPKGLWEVTGASYQYHCAMGYKYV
ncbi:hypothetical protein [Desulfallas thermosapovorans]|uniref:Uncharacterized protein n=1 Tax=Desulfallas thermosapovorans DSM 6562 TaxID=1121431 RepID=A0A5S4ZUN8_9FIRM|nr:hypothetical protein [Desulfallas thermosapovorans]TYO95935.1 hypothetical protein LX24_01325 [Desulfallas thermosapovorans DSM 6562]